MELNRVTIGVAILILLGLALVYLWVPSISPTALIIGSFPTYNPFVGKVTQAIDKMFVDNPQAVVEQSGRVGLLLPGGTSVQFAHNASSTEQDVVIILNATTTKITVFNTFPMFKSNEFTYVPSSELGNENLYVQALYPNGFYLLPVNVEGS